MRTALAAALLWGLAGQGLADAAATWRLDVFHTGGRGTEVFAVDEVVVEPLPWPGHPAGALDPTGFGSYRYEVREPDGRVVFSRGFGPIFAEWITTAEAATTYRTFHESFRFPAPAGPVDVVVFRRDATQAFVEAWRTRVDPASPFVNRAAPPPQALIEVERHGDSERKVDLLLARRRLHRGAMRRQVPRRCRPHGQRALRPRALPRAPPRLQRVGPVRAGGRSRRGPAVRRHPPPDAGRNHLRHLRVGALRAHLSEPRVPRRGGVGAVRIRHDPRQQRHLRRRRTLQRLLHRRRRQRVGRLSVRPRVRAPLRRAGR